MGKKRRSSGNRSTNPDRKCGKAWKKRPVDLSKRFTGRTIGGYSPQKIKARQIRRESPHAYRVTNDVMMSPIAQALSNVTIS